MSAAEGFDARALEQHYMLLDRLPEALFHPVATHLHGSLKERVQGLLQWNEALLAGRLPDLEGLEWPDRLKAELIRRELEALRLPHFCKGEQSLVEAVLLDVMEAVSTGMLQKAGWVADHLARLMEQEERARRAKKPQAPQPVPPQPVPPPAATGPRRIRRGGSAPRSSSGGPAASTGSTAGPVEPSAPAPEEQLDGSTLAAFKAEARRLASLQEEEALRKKLRDSWDERVRIWSELEEVFGELAMLLGRGWDLGRGLLRSRGWMEVMRLRELLTKLPQLKALIQALGRMSTSEDPTVPPVLETVIGPLRRVLEERREVPSPLARSETRGIERSGDIPRMLPGEAVLLGHPALRLLWHARRAERTLLTYRVEGVDIERVPVETEVRQARQHPRAAETRGPILICLDTSGSMQGTPELVAKALALEAMRVGFAEKRACYVYAFSGPGDVVEHELAMTEEGLARLMAFLTQSFSGGTDVTAPLARAVSRLELEGWGRADLLLVSDGEFEVPAATRELLARAIAQKGVRSHGILIGASSGAAMASICSPVHRFNTWSRFL